MEYKETNKKINHLENIICGLLDTIVTMSNDYNIDIHNGDSNYTYYKNYYDSICKGEK